MKLNRKNLFETIKEVFSADNYHDEEDNLNENNKKDFQKLMDIASDQDEGRGIQALEMMFAFELTEHQIRSLYNVALYNALEYNISDLPEVLEMRPEEYTDKEMAVHRDMAVKAIIEKTEAPEPLLKEIGFDFHNEFTQVYGVTPPRDKEFNFEPEELPWNQSDDIYLTIPTEGGGLIVFTFFFEGLLEDHPSDPTIYLRNRKGDEIWMDIDAGGNLRYDTEQGETGMSKEEVPDLIRKHMGYATTEPVKEWPGLPLGSAAPVREKLNRKYLYKMINEVLRENEEDDADFTNKIQDFLDSKDLESLKSALNLLDVYAMSGLIEDEEANNLKKRMYKVIQDERMVVSDPKGVYDFINSEEFSSSFDKFAMNDFRRETFSDLYVYSGRDIDKIVKLILPDYEERLEDYDGNPFSAHYVIEDLKGQSEVEEILARFKQFQGNGTPFAEVVTNDPPMFVLVGPFATSIANFGRDSKEVFGYRPKTVPEIDGERLFVEEGEGNPYLAKNSPLFDGKDVDYHIKIVKKMFGDWFMVIIFDEGYGGYLRIDYNSQSKSYKTSGKKDKIATMSTKEEMLSKIKEITNIDLTDVGLSHYERDMMKEENDDDDVGGEFLEKLLSLVDNERPEQAFELAYDLNMEKELTQSILKKTKPNKRGFIGLDVPDDAAVALVDYLKDHPDVDSGVREWLESSLPFETVGASFVEDGFLLDYAMYRSVAFHIFERLLKTYQNNALNEENFGRESRGDILEEGWKDQWPNEFGYLLGKITSSVGDKPDIFAEALVKIFYKVGRLQYLMPIKFLRSLKYKVIMYADKGIQEQKKKVDDLVKGIEYVKNEPAEYYTEEDRDKAIKELQRSLDTEQETLDKFEEFKSLADNPFYFGRERRKEVQKQGRAARAANPNDILPPMRVSNKLIKSLRKQLTKWRDKNVMNTEVYPYVGYALTDFTRSIQSQEDWAYEKTFEGDLATLVQFIKGLRGNQEDLGKKLMSIVNKGKDLNETEFIEAINKFIDEGRQIEFVDCKDAGPNDPCVFLRLDNGMFWHSTSVDYCEITQSKMANCGAASDPTGMLYNLMSNEGGTTKYYVTLEYSKSKDKVIQVLGKANTLPKEKYWSAITKFFDAVGNPILDKDAFMHMYNDVEDEMTKEELDQKIQEFVEGIGARMVPPPAIDSWKSMREQIRGGYYSDTVEDQPFGGPRVNLFRAAILHGKDEGNKAAMMLNIKMVVQTMKGRMKGDADLFEQERKRLKEYVESGELKKEILDFAIPEKYVNDPQREIHLKYSRSSDVKASMRTNGAIVIQVSFIFGVRTEPWTEARGEYLVENFNQLTKDTVNRLERVGLSTVFAVTPERAAEVYPEEAKRLADINDILGDLGLDEGKKKVKLDRNYLTSMILEVLGESNKSRMDEILYDLFNSGDPTYANQALETLITLERIPNPVQIDVNETWGSVYIKYNSNGELRQLIDLLDEYGFTQQKGSTPQTPAYFVHKPLVSKRAEPYRGDQEPPKPPPPTGLTLKL